MELFESLKSNVQGKDIRIVFPEATDERILEAVARLNSEQVITPILVGDKSQVAEKAKKFGFNLEGVEVLDPNHYEEFDSLVDAFVERRKGKATEDQAREVLLDVNYFGTMLVYTDKADGLVSGAIHSTGDTVRPALQIIKTREGITRTSGAFVMIGDQDHERYVFADCAINPEPDQDVLAEIAVESAKTAKMFEIDPKVAMLSFSTKGSAAGDQVDRVREATQLAKEKDPNLAVDGELQFDAAFAESVAKKKAPDSEIAGQANVFVFPDLQSGNIGYKIAQRLGNFDAVGPILQGLNKPISDLSRGCSAEDVYKLAIITANQSLIK